MAKYGWSILFLISIFVYNLSAMDPRSPKHFIIVAKYTWAILSLLYPNSILMVLNIYLRLSYVIILQFLGFDHISLVSVDFYWKCQIRDMFLIIELIDDNWSTPCCGPHINSNKFPLIFAYYLCMKHSGLGYIDFLHNFDVVCMTTSNNEANLSHPTSGNKIGIRYKLF